MQQLESGKVWGLWWLGEALLPLAGVHVTCCVCVVIICQISSPLSPHSAQAVLVSGNVSHRVKCDSGESSAQTRGVRTRQTNLRAGPCLCLWARNDNKDERNAGNIWAENRVSVTVCYSRFKTDRLLSLSSPLRVSPEYHCQSAAACFPYLSKSGQKYPPLNICQTQTPAVTSVSSVPSGATDNWGCGEQLWPCIGWWWPGGWPLTNIYNIVKISVTAPQTTAATYQPTIFTAGRSWNSPQSWLIQIHISTWCSSLEHPFTSSFIVYCKRELN